jgi:hypothetical protein
MTPLTRRDFCLSVAAGSALGFGAGIPVRGQSVGLTTGGVAIPSAWKRGGLIIQRSQGGDGANVVGDPCVVRDEEIDGWRMFLFFDPPGCGQAICPAGLDPVAGHWRLIGRLAFTNPEALTGPTHKPYVVMDAHRPNCAAKIDGHYILLTVSWQNGHKVI